jgi:hypothetical protein
MEIKHSIQQLRTLQRLLPGYSVRSEQNIARASATKQSLKYFKFNKLNQKFLLANKFIKMDKQPTQEEKLYAASRFFPAGLSLEGGRSVSGVTVF